MVNNIDKNCDCCNKNTDKLMKAFVNDQPIGEQNFVSSYRLCQECFTLHFTDPDTFLEKIRE